MSRSHIRYARLTLAVLLCTAVAHAQTTFADPANLAGERPTPRTGRELPIDSGARGLQQLLRRLSTRASVMNIVAHPDDEDGGMLTFYSRGLGARVADLSLTRGEGGQNAMTGDFEDALGLLRTQELLSCDRYSGVDQFFGTEVDFGFSKTKAESFTKWGHDRVLYDVVRAVRIYRPLILVSTWIGAATDGHGQHQVSGQIAQEAFVAAADPNVFPELTREGILPWQPLRVYARVPMQSISSRGLYDYATGQYVPAEFPNYVTGKTSTTPPSTDVIVHEGDVDPILSEPGEGPLSYVQFARRGLSEQRSQIGPGPLTAPSGEYDVAYHLYGSRICSDASVLPPSPNRNTSCIPAIPLGPSANTTPTFFDGIDTSLNGIASLAPEAFPPDFLASIQRGILAAAQQYDPSHPEATVPIIKVSLDTLDTLIAAVEHNPANPLGKASALHELRIKRAQLNDALALSLGVSLTATAHEPGANDHPQPGDPIGPIHDANITPGEKILIQSQLTLPKLNGLREINSFLRLNGKTLLCDPCTNLTDDLTVLPATRLQVLTLPTDATITRPFYSRDNIEQPVYTHVDPELRDAPAPPAPLIATRVLDYNATPFTVSVAVEGSVQNTSADGAIPRQPVVFVPPANLSLDTHARVLPLPPAAFSLSVFTYQPGTQLHLDLPRGWSAEESARSSDSSIQRTTFAVKPLGGITAAATVGAHLDSLDGGRIAEGYRPVGYAGLPQANYFFPATTRVVPVNLNLPQHARIAYLPGTGDEVPADLQSLGLTVTQLTVGDLNPTTLAHFDTVILGVRTYAAHADLHGGATQALLDYARSGGNVIVQYQTQEFTAADAPYPLDLGSNEKVVDETAPVTLLDRSAPLLTTPNVISTNDFNNWIEERGHGFLSTWDAHYTALTETHDPGAPAEHVAPQSPQRGGLITVQLGTDPKHLGRWTYCAFALYRQLPEAVPGAYRLFANLITP